MSDYTPTTEEVRELYWACSGDPRRDSGAWDEFDRWLAGVKAEARIEFADELTRVGVYSFDIHQIRKYARGEA